MDTEKGDHALEEIPANRRLIEELHSHGKITREAREYALDILYPHDQWGLWVSRFLLAVGTALMLSGIVYLFAFNWAKFPPMAKLFSIQFGIVGCLAGAYFRSLRRMGGQVLLLSGSILVGVFMAVFGQIYQTGADAYQLFMMWALLTSGWTLISGFAAQWVFWLVVANTALVLWWRQAALPAKEMEFMIFIYIAILNGTALAFREYFAVKKSCEWLKARWTRVLLTIAVLLSMLIPIMAWSLSSEITASVVLSCLIGLVGHGAAYLLYRYKLPDAWSLAATVISVCMVVEAVGFRIFSEIFSLAPSVMFLFAGLMTLGVFIYAIIHLRKALKDMEAEHV